MKSLIVLFSFIFFVGCSNTRPTNTDTNQVLTVAQIETNDYNFKLHLRSQGNDPSLIDAYDPLESLNRRLYYFNSQLDNFVILPVTDSYKFFFPGTARTGVRNFFNNLQEPLSAINGALILDSKAFVNSVSRFLINSTIGIVGLFDVASEFNIIEQKRTLNETLAVYGVHQGPYLILPVLGPSDLRGSVSSLTTSIITSPLDPLTSSIGQNWQKFAIRGLDPLDKRSRVNFKYYSLNSPFEYEYVRFLYLTSTKARIESLKNK